MSENERLRRLIQYLVFKLRDQLTRTKLIKPIYLYDRAATRQDLDTGVDYFNYYHGPYSQEIVEQIRDMNGYQIIEDKRVTLNEGRVYYAYKPGPLMPDDAGSLLREDEKRVIDEIIERYGGLSLDRLLEDVYRTDEYAASEFGEKLKFSLR